MIIDVTGTELIPGNCGNNCPGRGLCCDECDFLSCCLENFDVNKCEKCDKTECPNNKEST
ncbi:MAG: hypothetical protein IKW02_01655 [Clostridia bacterium]|nr:hypothetical protein [Clostridia bacterium]